MCVCASFAYACLCVHVFITCPSAVAVCSRMLCMYIHLLVASTHCSLRFIAKRCQKLTIVTGLRKKSRFWQKLVSCATLELVEGLQRVCRAWCCDQLPNLWRVWEWGRARERGRRNGEEGQGRRRVNVNRQLCEHKWNCSSVLLADVAEALHITSYQKLPATPWSRGCVCSSLREASQGKR